MLRPLQDYVVLEKVKEEVKTASGIILTEKPKDEPSTGIVIAIGEGKIVDGKRFPISLKEGEKVIYKKFAGTEVSNEGKKYLLISVDDILAVVE